MHRLAGKSALITGAASGLGRACALRFAAEGAAVACVDVAGTPVAEVVEEIVRTGGQALALTADVTSSADTEAMTATAIETFGQLDIVLANAGIAGNGRADDLTEEEWDRVMAVNLKGVWLTSRFALPHMLDRGTGVLLHQASIGGLVGFPDIFPYSAAKGGVIAMTRQMAAQYGPSGIRVNAICPGTVFTPLIAESRRRFGVADLDHDVLNARTAERYPLRRIGEVDDVAALAVFLASDEAGWITGAVYPVDGGRSAI